MNKKLLITSNTSWFIFNFFVPTIKEMIREGYVVHLLTPSDKYTDRLVEVGCIHHQLDINPSGGNPVQEIRTIIRIFRVIKALNPYCVLNFTPKLNVYSGFCCRLIKVPVVNSVAGLGSIFLEDNFKAKVGKLLLKASQNRVDHVIFQNPDDLQIYLKEGYTQEDRISLVGGIGVDLKKFVPHQAKDDNTVRFILVARLLRSKGVGEFVEAAIEVDKYMSSLESRRDVETQAKRAEFYLLGFVDESNPQAISRETIETWHTNTAVNYLGQTDDVFSVVKEMDCVVLPSYYREGMPQCLIEAAAMAKPIITTDNVGCREIVVNNESGFIVKPKCVDDLKLAMIKMIEMTHQQRLELGKVGRRKAENEYCHLKISKHYIEVIESIANRKSSI
ncbi:glycosyltransferase family 4 protein [Ferrimonas balearica]|uniref:glycosyltransferase family 4 protein n=1 Tax=Ferrimonas balearica TaxID=44012 RepID=UPI001C5816FF|nr:glycosyltransferase family 4 protein [Ferrimonas balearica]MBW3164252.1 glycosyltransferase family 4 protein [Ferrimonas balearica]